MKKLITVISAICAVSFTPAAVNASIFYTDTFSYPDGVLTTVASPLWVGHSGTGTFIPVAAGQISLAQGSGSRQDVNRATGSTIGAGQTWYAGFDVAVSGGSATAYFAHFISGTSVFGDRLFVTPTTGDFTFGISQAGGAPDVSWGTALSFGTTYRVVLSYDFDTGANKLWVNPTVSGDTSITWSGVASTAFTGFAFRQGSGDSVQVIDNLVVGTTFNDVVVVPEPASAAIIGLGLLALGFVRRQS
jgi:hypothetical protein